LDLIERIGAFLGLAAFLGFAVLVLLVIQQARDVRRLRNWAGQAPERAIEAAETRGEELPEPERGPVTRRLVSWGAAVHDWIARTWSRVIGWFRSADRRSPIDLRVLGAIVVLAGIAAAAFLTSGFGLLEDDAGDGPGDGQGPNPRQIEVAVLNGTAGATGSAVPGLAQEAGRLVEDAGYRLGEVTNTDESFLETQIMFAPGEKAAADLLAEDMEPELGRTPTRAIAANIEALAGGADVALVLGIDDEELAQGGEPPPQ
jgi:LytR cell envelope-related transcriptional attenuator